MLALLLYPHTDQLPIAMNPIIRARVRKCLAAIARDVSRNVDYVNCGGCGIYAIELAKRMKKLGFTDMKLRVYSYPNDNNERLVNVASIERKVFGDNLPDNLRDWGVNGVNFCHVRMEWGFRVWDVEGDEPAKTDKAWRWFPRHPGSLSLKAMNRLSAKTAGWNTMFDRAQIPLMRRIMNKHFAELRAFIEEQNNLPLAA